MLLIKILPYENETLSSFIYRTAKANYMDNLNWIMDLLNETTKTNIKVSALDWIQQPSLDKIGMFLGINENEAHKMTFHYHQNRLGLPFSDLIKNPWFIYRTIKICPLCLIDSPFIRTDWCLSQSICCVKHNKYLVDSCHNCNRDLTTKMVISGECLCGQCINQLEAKDVKTEDCRNYQTFLNHYFYNGTDLKCNEWINSSSTFFKALEFFATWIPLIVNNGDINSVDGFSYDGSAHARTRLKKSRSVSQSIVLYCLAYSVLQDWPYSYHEILENSYKYDERKLELFFIRGIKPLVNTSLDNISSEFTRFLQTFLLNVGPSNRLLRMDEAKSLISRYKEVAINENSLSSYKCFLHISEISLVYANEVQNWLEKLKTLITKEEIREFWQTSSKATYSILSNEILDDVYQFRTGSVSAWGISKHSIENLMNRLKQYNHQILDKISLNNAFQWIGPEQAHHIVKGMINGDLNYILNDDVFGKSLISRQQCYYFTEKILIEEAKIIGKISIRNLIFILGVKKSDINYWIRTGKLTSVGEEVTFSSFISFYRTYLTSYQLAFKKNLQVKQIIKLNTINKIKAASGPHTGEGKRLLFLIADLNLP